MKNNKDIIRFVLKCILFPLSAILVITALNRPYKKIDAEKYLDVTKFDLIDQGYWEIRVANLGSSHGAYDFVYDDITSQGFNCFNFANTSQTYDYDYAILKQYGQYLVPGKTVLFIPVSYFSFNNEVVNETEAQAMSLRYYHFLSPENIPDYDPYVDLITNRLPVLSAGEDILKLFPALPGSLAVHAQGNGIDVKEFAKRARERYSRHFDNKKEYFMQERISELYDIIGYCKEHEITPVLITTPFSKYYRELVTQEFLQKFQETVNGIATDTGVVYYDYSDDARFNENLQFFSDSDHLNEEGARYFMEILIAELPELERFR